MQVPDFRKPPSQRRSMGICNSRAHDISSTTHAPAQHSTILCLDMRARSLHTRRPGRTACNSVQELRHHRQAAASQILIRLKEVFGHTPPSCYPQLEDPCTARNPGNPGTWEVDLSAAPVPNSSGQMGGVFVEVTGLRLRNTKDLQASGGLSLTRSRCQAGIATGAKCLCKL